MHSNDALVAQLADALELTLIEADGWHDDSRGRPATELACYGPATSALAAAGRHLAAYPPIEGLAVEGNKLEARRTKLAGNGAAPTSLVLRYFLGAAYPVDTSINPRGYNWSEAYLDQARAAALELHAHGTAVQRTWAGTKPDGTPTVETETLAGAVWNAPASASQVDPRQATPPGRWSGEVPTEAGDYWHWNGRQGSLPTLITGRYSPDAQQLVGAGGEPLAMLRGYWWRIYQPPTTGMTPQSNPTTT